MVRAKSDCTGQKFGYLTVLGKGDRRLCNNTYTQLWKLQCDCGTTIEKPRRDFDNNKGHKPSCGCQKRLRIIERNHKRAKPDCTGQKFGRLLVLGKDGSHPKHGHLWKLRCDCGNLVSLPRSYFDRASRGQVSCGCLRSSGEVDNKRRPQDITGQRFGSLIAVALTGRKDTTNQPTWLLQCNCGNTCERSLKRLNSGYKLNCGDKIHLPGSWYPPTPNPYPKEAGELLVKYLYLTRLDNQIDSTLPSRPLRNKKRSKRNDVAIEDEKRDRLIRAAWIITYRRQQGEVISELHESRIIHKHLRYCSVNIYWQRKLEKHGGLVYDVSGNKKSIGVAMDPETLSVNYPVIETQGIKLLPKNPPAKKFKFKRR